MRKSLKLFQRLFTVILLFVSCTGCLGPSVQETESHIAAMTVPKDRISLQSPKNPDFQNGIGGFWVTCFLRNPIYYRTVFASAFRESFKNAGLCEPEKKAKSSGLTFQSAADGPPYWFSVLISEQNGKWIVKYSLMDKRSMFYFSDKNNETGRQYCFEKTYPFSKKSFISDAQNEIAEVIESIKELDPVPNMPSVEQWRADFKKKYPGNSGNAAQVVPAVVENPLQLKEWKYDQSNQTARFTFLLKNQGADMFDVRKKALRQIREVCTDEYKTANPNVAGRLEFSLISEFKMPEFIVDVTVYQIKPLHYSYDSSTRVGTITLSIGQQNYADAYKWAIENIGVICSSKEVALESGRPIPEGARFEILSEKTNANNQLDIKFHVLQ